MSSNASETPPQSPPEGEGPLRPGSVAPDFELSSIPEGQRVELRSMTASESATLVVFWSAVCSHCRRYDDLLNGFADRYPQIPLWVVAARRSETADALARAHRERGLRFRLLYDTDLAVAHIWGVRQTPTAFLLDSAHRVLYRGAIDDFSHPDSPGHRPYLESAIADALAGRSVAAPETAAFGCPVDSVYYTRIGSGPRSEAGSRGGGR